MNLLNEEYLTSLIYRHRNDDGLAVYLDFFGFNRLNEPFPIFPVKGLSVARVTNRYLPHALDLLEQDKNIMLMLSSSAWCWRSAFDSYNAQLRVLMPQNIEFSFIDAQNCKPTQSWLLRELMRAVGIERIVKEDDENLKKYFLHVNYVWDEFRKKQFVVLFRSDNLSFSQLKFLKDILVKRDNDPLIYYLLEGSIETYNHFRDMRKELIWDFIYNYLFVFQTSSLATLKENMEHKLGRSIESVMQINFFNKLYFISRAGTFPLMHTVLYRMMKRHMKVLESIGAFNELLNEIEIENKMFKLKREEYIKRMNYKDYIFAPEMIRNSLSITEAQRFLKWMDWND